MAFMVIFADNIEGCSRGAGYLQRSAAFFIPKK
jgi:hypothetical protein